MKRLLSAHWLAGIFCLLLVSGAWGPVRASTPAQEPSFPTQGTVNANANLREGPGTTYPKVGGVKAGDTVFLAGCNDDCTWYQLKGRQWIFAELVDVDSAGATAPAAAKPAPAPAAKPAAIFGDPDKVCRALAVEGLAPMGSGWSDEALGYFNCFSDDLNVTTGNFAAVGDVPNSLNYGAESDFEDRVETITLVADIFNTAKEAPAVKSFGAMAATMFQRLGLEMPSGLAAAISGSKSASYTMPYGEVTLSRETYNLGYGLKLQIQAAVGAAAAPTVAAAPTRTPAPTPTPKPKPVEYDDMLANIWTGVKVYYGNGAEKAYGFEILGGGECSFGTGVFVEYEDGTREWKSREALLYGPFYVRADDPATSAWEWYEYECYQ